MSSSDNLVNSDKVVVNFATLMPAEEVPPLTKSANTNNTTRNSYSTYIETGDVVIPLVESTNNNNNKTAYSRNTSSSSMGNGKPPAPPPATTINKAIRVEPSPSGVTRIYINHVRNTNNHVIDKVKQVNEIAAAQRQQFHRSGSKTSLSSLKEQQQQKAKEAFKEQSASLTSATSMSSQPPPAPPLPPNLMTSNQSQQQQQQQASQSLNNSNSLNQCSSTPCSAKNNSKRGESSSSSQRLNDFVETSNTRQSESNGRDERGLYVVNIDQVDDDDDDDEEEEEKQPVLVSNSTQQSSTSTANANASVKNISAIKGGEFEKKESHHLTLNSQQEILNDEIERERSAAATETEAPRTETFYDGCKVWTALTDAEQSDDETELIPMEEIKQQGGGAASDLTKSKNEEEEEDVTAVRVNSSSGGSGKEKRLVKKKIKKSDKEKVDSGKNKKRVKISLPNEGEDMMNVSASSANLMIETSRKKKRLPARNMQKCCFIIFLLFLFFVATGILIYFFAWNIYNSQLQG